MGRAITSERSAVRRRLAYVLRGQRRILRPDFLKRHRIAETIEHHADRVAGALETRLTMADQRVKGNAPEGLSIHKLRSASVPFCARVWKRCSSATSSTLVWRNSSANSARAAARSASVALLSALISDQLDPVVVGDTDLQDRQVCLTARRHATAIRGTEFANGLLTEFPRTSRLHPSPAQGDVARRRGWTGTASGLVFFVCVVLWCRLVVVRCCGRGGHGTRCRFDV